MSFTQLGPDIDGEAGGDESGHRVSLSSDGSVVAIAAPFNDGNGTDSGHTRIYQWDSASSSWNQLGSDIDGEAAGDRSGHRRGVALSSDGSVVAIGAQLNDGNGSDSGHTRIYQWDSASSSWNQLGSDIDGEAAGDYSGGSVSLSSDGSVVAIGAANNDGNGTRSGHTRIYQWDSASSSWNQLGSDIDGEAAFDGSGACVSLSSDGSVVAIGAPDNDGNRHTGSNKGHTRIYQWDSASSSWNQLGSDIDGEADGDRSGLRVSLSSDGSIVAIGATQNNANGSQSGHTRIYKWDSASSSWNQLGSDIDAEAAGDYSGTVSLSSDGSVVAIGAHHNDGNGTSAGHTRIYQWDSASSSWNQLGSDIDGEAAGDNSGVSVSLSSDGSAVAIGAPHNHGLGPGTGVRAGHVRVFSLDTTAPTFSSAATNNNGTKIILTYDETLSSTTASTSAFTVSSGGVANAVTAVAISGSTVELTLTNTIKKSETITVAYSDPTSSNDANAVQDSSGNDAATLSAQSVTNNSTVAAISSSGGSTSNNASTSNNDSNRETESGNTLLLNDNNSFSVTTGASNGLWLTLKVLSASTSLQNTLILIDQNNNVLGSIGATQFSKNCGSHAIFIPEGSTISFQQSSNNQPINNSPQHTITQQSDGSYKLHLNDNTRDSDHDDLILDISYSSASPDPSATSMASKQQNIHDAILDLSSIPADGQTLQITLNSDCAFINRFALVKLNQQSSGEFTVGGYNNTAGKAFDQNVYDSIINPGGSIITATGLQQQTFEWSLSATDAGFYAPVLINPAGDIHTYGSSHVKNLGSNLFAFEDDSQISNPDYDFNDLTAKFQIIT
ncbi:putative cadherin domain-containing protein [Synechococcus sp. A18-25c]|uniref:SwmB domain-containing protein n=1 Tax=Synechococcus sp. A18-25c TaxID=1866938 RepID=UPI001647F542|nr:SwmB domain-containing protein [Synechococcus sp. A18-25c]QNJ20342.1 putative cadherin domain-containing protein [Synechococcus sp. A18-25c]